MLDTLLPQGRVEGSWPSGCYALHGLTVESDITMPTAEFIETTAKVPHIRVSRIESRPPVIEGPPVLTVPCAVHGTDAVQYRDSRGTSIWFHSVGTVRISRDFRHVDVYPDLDADDRLLGLTVSGPILLFIRHKLGLPALHASAVVTESGAVGFLGASGHGKSTLASLFIRRGATLLTDDALLLRERDGQIVADPGSAFMKVWQTTLDHALGIGDELPTLLQGMDKKLLRISGRFERTENSMPIRHLYVLERFQPDGVINSDISIRRLTGREALIPLLIHTSGRLLLLPSDMTSAMAFYGRLLSQARVSVLRYPSGFESQDAVCSRVFADLEEA